MSSMKTKRNSKGGRRFMLSSYWLYLDSAQATQTSPSQVFQPNADCPRVLSGHKPLPAAGTSHGKRLHRPWGFTQDLLPVLGSGLGQLQASPAPGSWALPHLSPADPPTVRYWLPPSPMCSLRTGKTRIRQVAPGGPSWATQSR